MKVHIVLLFLLPCSSASRVRLTGDTKGGDEALWAYQPGGRRPTIGAPPAVRLHALAFPEGEPDQPDPDSERERIEALRKQLERSFNLPMPGEEQGVDHLPDLKPARWKAATHGFQVFVDLVDTLFASGGGPSGVDKSFYQKESYPGALQFMLELSRGPQQTHYPAKIVPFSSRPGKLLVRESSHVFKDVKKVGVNNGFDSWGLDLHEEYRTKPGKPVVFVGDNGAADVAHAERMALTGHDRLQAAFIHVVQPTTKDNLPQSTKIHLFDTYYDAAAKALTLGLISEAGLKRVEKAFTSSNIVQMCEHLDMFKDGRYPCIIDKEKELLVDSVTFEPLPEELTLDIHDGTAVFTECNIEEWNNDSRMKSIDPTETWSRCSSIHRVTNFLSQQERMRKEKAGN